MDKDYIINHFKVGIKEPINIKIGVEHEKFLFYKKNNKRINYSTIKEIFKILYEFGWKPSHEGENVICLLYTSPSPRDKRQSRMPSSA